MSDVIVVEATDNVNDCIALTDVSEELVSETCALRSTLNKTCDVEKFNYCRSFLVGIPVLAKLVESLIGNSNNTAVRLDCAERIVGCLSVGSACDSVEKC